MNWRFYGRKNELIQISGLLDRRRWFFCAITGRRRIGKTQLIQEALRLRPVPSLYVQIPDSEEVRVARAFRDAVEDYGLIDQVGGRDSADAVKDFSQMARAIGRLCRSGVIVVLDEFQYFHRKALHPFLSFLQAEVDRLRNEHSGGLFILGSIHTEMMSIIEDQSSPLFGRLTDELRVNHWDFGTLLEVFDAHGLSDPNHWLFLWSMLEGVPKFYRDAHQANVLKHGADYRASTLERLFFTGTSPLRDEAEHWFLRELRGRYDTVLDILARHQPCGHGDLVTEYRTFGEEKALAGYLQQLMDRFGIVTRLEPVFAPKSHRRGRYIISDNFLAAWLSSLDRAVKMGRIRPVAQAVGRGDELLMTREGFAFEKLIRLVLEEHSRLGYGDLELSEQVRGYWDKPDTAMSSIEIDSIVYNDEERVVRFGSCKRSAAKHNLDSLRKTEEHIARFLQTKVGKRFIGWKAEKVLYAPAFGKERRALLKDSGFLCVSLGDLARPYRQ